MINKVEGVNELEKYKKAGKLDLNKLLEIEKKYQLGYYKISEVVPKEIVFKMHALKEYGNESNGEKLSTENILKLLIKNPKLLWQDLTEVQVVSLYLGLTISDAEEMVKRHKESSTAQAKKVLNNMIEGLNDALSSKQ